MTDNSKNNNGYGKAYEGLRIGISGGTFDPIHMGHLIIAEDIREKFSLDKIVFIPTGNPPHKNVRKITDAKLRFDMVKSAISTNPWFEASNIEVAREGYTYTVDTLTQLRDMFGLDTKLYFIIGADVVFDLLSWRCYEKVFSLCEFIAALRPGYGSDSFYKEIERLKEGWGAVIHTVQAPLVDISSTGVRERVKAGKSVRYLVPEAVDKFIAAEELYI